MDEIIHQADAEYGAVVDLEEFKWPFICFQFFPIDIGRRKFILNDTDPVLKSGLSQELADEGGFSTSKETGDQVNRDLQLKFFDD